MDVPAKGNVLGGCLPARYILAILGLVGMVVIHGLNENLNFSGVSARMMVNHTAIKMAIMAQNNIEKKYKVFSSDVVCNYPCCDDDIPDEYTNILSSTDGPMDTYPGKMFFQSYKWGYQASIFYAAHRAELQSAKWVMFIGVSISIICSIVTPVIGWMGWMFFFTIIRMVQGMAAGTAYPAIHVLLAKWSPLTERGFMTTIVNSGKSLGPVLSALIASALITTVGWQGVFFISAMLSVIWCILWVLLTEDSPQRQRLITIEERNMIVAALGNVIGDHPYKKESMPKRLMFKSPAFLSILLTYSTFNCGYFTLIFWFPLYMEEVMKYNLNEDIFTLTFTILSQVIFSLSLSIVLDTLHRKQIITITTARKISTGFATAVPSFCLILICITGCDRVAAVVLWGMAVTASGGIFGGVYANIIDIAPTFAGTVVAMCDCVSVLIIIITMPIIMLVRITGNLLFIITIVVYIIGLVVYCVWGSSEPQAWSKPPNEDNDNIELTQTQHNGEATNQPAAQDT